MLNNRLRGEDRNVGRMMNDEKWCAPKVGWVKINWDGAFSIVEKKTRVKVIIRESRGRMMDGASCSFRANCALQVEAMIVKKRVSLAIEKRLKRVIVEIDLKELFLTLNNKCSMLDWRIKPLVVDIQKMLKLIPDCKIELIKRIANAMADWITVNAKKGICMSSWVRHRPSSLVRILDKDGLSTPL